MTEAGRARQSQGVTNTGVTRGRPIFGAGLAAAALLFTGCGDDTLDAGSTRDAGAQAEPPSGAALPEWPDAAACAASSDSDLVGLWEGAVQSATFERLARLRVEVLGASETGGVCGTVHFGEDAPPLPAATDPNEHFPESYPPGWEGFYDGVAYTILEGAMQRDRIHFVVSRAELFKGWCELHESYYVGHSEWFCIPTRSYMAVSETVCRYVDLRNGSTHNVDFEQCNACMGGTCACNDEGCTATGDPNERLTFDLQREGDEILGNLDPRDDTVLLDRQK